MYAENKDSNSSQNLHKGVHVRALSILVNQKVRESYWHWLEFAGLKMVTLVNSIYSITSQVLF